MSPHWHLLQLLRLHRQPDLKKRQSNIKAVTDLLTTNMFIWPTVQVYMCFSAGVNSEPSVVCLYVLICVCLTFCSPVCTFARVTVCWCHFCWYLVMAALGADLRKWFLLPTNGLVINASKDHIAADHLGEDQDGYYLSRLTTSANICIVGKFHQIHQWNLIWMLFDSLFWCPLC